MKNKAFNFWALLKLDFQFEMYIYLPRHIHFITGQRRKCPKMSKIQKQWDFCVSSHESLASKSFSVHIIPSSAQKHQPQWLSLQLAQCHAGACGQVKSNMARNVFRSQRFLAFCHSSSIFFNITLNSYKKDNFHNHH